MRILGWFRHKKEPVEETAPIGECAHRFDAKPFLVEPEDILLTVLGYIADMLSDKRLIPTYLRSEMAAAHRLPAEAWELARKSREECPSEFMGIRDAALEHTRRVATAVLMETSTGNWNS